MYNIYLYVVHFQLDNVKHTGPGPHSNEVTNIRKDIHTWTKSTTDSRFEMSQSHLDTGLYVIPPPPRFPWGSDVTTTKNIT